MTSQPKRLIGIRSGVRSGVQVGIDRIGGSRLDPAVAAFAAASGATDLAGLDELIRYVRSEGLLPNFRIYPMKAAQNAGSGSTVYGIGSLTANNMTLVNSPTWEADGITFNGTNQYMEAGDFLDASTLTVFVKTDQLSAATGTQMLLEQATSISNISRRAFYGINSNLQMQRSTDGTTTNREFATKNSYYTVSEILTVLQWISGGGRSLWKNKTLNSFDTLFSPNTSAFDSSAPVRMFADAFSVGFNNCQAKAAAFLLGPTPTTTQRETITDLINAL